ncbi:hypothetical protein LEP1GSC193_2021 [Leptospira alstonii serovar Pingchang str. 80-412]|uniref:Uncharacterized protein n=2 Tax=Leptospira alstonii TaxID=28452 RepID=M6DBN4_9LEPT|nr:hypothetical protein LEP1GSC194_0576 [Leptospira alstonii serovar Sichuan str. 79601]EQA79791.1 hypothetical protein LEP1GSC193_2021 [Leptospira alstonii serovar Pingchang str. 80-412]
MYDGFVFFDVVGHRFFGIRFYFRISAYDLETHFDTGHSVLRNRIDVLVDSLAIRFGNDYSR